jgi:NADH-quinone oxidoreductase subunit L
MVLACGVGAYSAGIFHLMTHAFFKALLFLAAGSVIHAMSGEQDMRVMGGLRKHIPITFWTMTVGVFAIAGIPPLSGFFSKDEILFQTFSHGGGLYIFLWLVGLLTAGLTSFYMFRLWFKTFFGAPRFDENALAHGHGAHDAQHGHASSSSTLTLEAEHDSGQAAHAHGVHESPLVMTFPLMILALLAVVGGWVGIPFALGGHNEFEHFLDPVFATASEPVAAVASHGVEIGLAVISVLVALTGLFIAYFLYIRKPGTSKRLVDANGATKFGYSLLDHKYWVDEIYGHGIVTPLLGFSRVILNGLVDGGIVQGTVAIFTGTTGAAASLARRMQSGNIRSYAGWLALGAAAAIAVVLFGHYPLH